MSGSQTDRSPLTAHHSPLTNCQGSSRGPLVRPGTLVHSIRRLAGDTFGHSSPVRAANAAASPYVNRSSSFYKTGALAAAASCPAASLAAGRRGQNIARLRAPHRTTYVASQLPTIAVTGSAEAIWDESLGFPWTVTGFRRAAGYRAFARPLSAFAAPVPLIL
jgi:hypothetical protein